MATTLRDHYGRQHAGSAPLIAQSPAQIRRAGLRREARYNLAIQDRLTDALLPVEKRLKALRLTEIHVLLEAEHAIQDCLSVEQLAPQAKRHLQSARAGVVDAHAASILSECDLIEAIDQQVGVLSAAAFTPGPPVLRRRMKRDWDVLLVLIGAWELTLQHLNAPAD
mgnify:CR=1 FL=1